MIILIASAAIICGISSAVTYKIGANAGYASGLSMKFREVQDGEYLIEPDED